MDGYVKIWNKYKTLIREIKFAAPILTVCFVNDQGDLIVGISGQLSLILAREYRPFESEKITSKE